MKKIVLLPILVSLLLFAISCWDEVASNDSTDKQTNDPAKFIAVKDSLGSQFTLKTDSTAIAGTPVNIFLEISNYYKIDSIGAYYLNSNQSTAEKTVLPLQTSNDSIIHIGNITFNKAGLTQLYYFVQYQDSSSSTVVDVINFFVKGCAPKITVNDSTDTLFAVKELDTLTIKYKISGTYTNSEPYFSSIKNLPVGALFDTATGIFTYIPNTDITVKDSIAAFSPLYIVGSDNSTPPVSDSIPLYISVIDSPSSTAGPTIVQQTGTKDSERIKVSTDTLTFEITDPDGIDSIYYKLNDIMMSPLNLIATNTYQLILTLTQYGSNKIEIVAKDNSTLSNKTTKLININFNTVPSLINSISPADGTEGVDHSSGVNLNWSGGTDSDGDSITYTVSYSNNTSAFTTVNTSSKSYVLANLQANTTYNWYVQVATILDTIRCPSTENSYYSFKTKDEGAPSIVQTSGPIEGEYVLTSTSTLTFDIADENGLDSVYFQLNNDAAISAINTLNNEYKITVNFSEYGSNEIVLTAVDGSTSKNKSTKTINLIYYSIPTSVIALSPANNAINVENIGGANLKWNSSTDADGDSIKYEVFYGENSTSLTSAIITDTTYLANSIKGGTEYLWFVNVITNHDTIRCPEGISSYWKFITINHPSVITGMNNKTATINDSVYFIINATDNEGIKEFKWDTDNDGIFDITSTTGKLGIKSQNTVGTQKIKVKVIDDLENETIDSSIITVTNESPLIIGLSDTITCYLGDSIQILVNYSDDGEVTKYEWDFGKGFVENDVTDTSIILSNMVVPTSLKYIVAITDDDGNIAKDTLFINVPIKMEILNKDTNVILSYKTNVFKHRRTGKYNKIDSYKRVETLDFINWDTTALSAHVGKSYHVIDFPTQYWSEENEYAGVKNWGDALWLATSSGDTLVDSLPNEAANYFGFNNGYIVLSETMTNVFLIGGYREFYVDGPRWQDTIFFASFGDNEFMSIGYLEAPSYQIPVFQRDDTLWVINGRDGNKLSCFYTKELGGIGSFNKIYDKELGFSSLKEVITLNGEDMYIVTNDGRIYISKDNGDKFQLIINDNTTIGEPLNAFIINDDEMVIVEKYKMVKIDIKAY